MIERLAEAIGYPERIPGGTRMFTLRVDGMEIAAEDTPDGIILSYTLTDDESMFTRLSEYAAGRILRESAAVAYGKRPSHVNPSLFLWQGAPSNADDRALLRLFETFMDSCDWWRPRVDALGGKAAEVASTPEQMMIRP